MSRDIHLRVAEQRSQASDEPGFVLVGDVEHVVGQLGLDRYAR